MGPLFENIFYIKSLCCVLFLTIPNSFYFPFDICTQLNKLWGWRGTGECVALAFNFFLRGLNNSGLDGCQKAFFSTHLKDASIVIFRVLNRGIFKKKCYTQPDTWRRIMLYLQWVKKVFTASSIFHYFRWWGWCQNLNTEFKKFHKMIKKTRTITFK